MILVLSGTMDGRKLIEEVLEQGFKVLATTATHYGGQLIKRHANLSIISERLNDEKMVSLIREQDIKCIIDATHPYAREVSITAMESSSVSNIPYIRYERKEIDYDGIESFPTFESLVKWLENKRGNILLTIGSKHLEVFNGLRNRENMFIRVLPTALVIEKCEGLGFSPRQIIGLQGPFSKAFNQAIYDLYNIKYMVTKDSGEVGGTSEKVLGALEKGIKVLLVERPKIEYKNICSDMGEVIQILKKLGGTQK